MSVLVRAWWESKCRHAIKCQKQQMSLAVEADTENKSHAVDMTGFCPT